MQKGSVQTLELDDIQSPSLKNVFPDLKLKRFGQLALSLLCSPLCAFDCTVSDSLVKALSLSLSLSLLLCLLPVSPKQRLQMSTSWSVCSLAVW